ncbi:peptidoglycan-binding domain-containing protein [Nocardiopsis sp. FIRDI 009]|uniref:peptidoglycan-binding domain-containing protein n=1 Tax=Nocardiopsis sp. FIRDI 009 TaxID=714197 RepID=UPI0013004871|nr:peptidoglycan-binding domain-containing protein [Nocardiopsis sp. FIRDI 009]
MAVTVDNSLSGPNGTTPTAASLEATARTGTTGVVAPERSVYSASRTLHGLGTIDIATGHHRANSTPRLEVALPPAPWHMRWYVYPPSLQAAGFGVDEVRWVARLGSYGLVLHETSGGDVGLRLQADGLAQNPLVPTLSGVSVQFGQWLRVEATSDGTDTVVRVYPGHATIGARVATWSGTGLPGNVTAEVTAYRYRRGVLLQPGDKDVDLPGTPVQDRQRQILVWDPDELPVYRDDGDYGQETVTAVERFQNEFGLVPVDGEIGPETGAALDLVVAEIQGDPLPPSTHVSHLAVSDSAAIGPADTPLTSAATTLEASGDATVTPDFNVVTAVANVGAVDSAQVTKEVTLSASATAEVSDETRMSKDTTVLADTTVEVSGSAGVTQSAGVAVDYAAGHISAPFEPVEDDLHVANDITVSGAGGEYRLTVTDGPLGVGSVGRYKASDELNVDDEGQLPSQAGWRAHLGTHDDARYPVVHVNLAGSPELAGTIATRDCGDSLQVLNPPPWLPPRPIELLIQGYEERLNLYRWDVTFNASSGEPWIVGEVADGAAVGSAAAPDRADTTGSALASAVDETETALSVDTGSGPPWITSAEYPDDFPFDVVVDGAEVVRVASIVGDGSSAPQTLEVARGINGITKPHQAGADVRLAQPMTTAL